MKRILLIFICMFLMHNSFAQWAAMGSGPGGVVRALCVNGNSLYAGGDFTGLVKRWNNSGNTWEAVGSLSGSKVYALISFNGELYAGGTFSVPGATTTYNVAKLSGNSWVAVGSGLGPNTFSVLCLYNYSGSLFAGGTFTTSGTASVSKVAKLVGGVWQQVGGGAPPNCSAGVYAMAKHGNELYVGGQGSAPWINKLNIQQIGWESLTTGGPDGGVGIYALTSFIYPSTSSPSLFIGGDFSNGPSPTVCVYSSNNWGTSVNTFSSGSTDEVNCFIATSVGTGQTATGTLYAGGTFSVTGINATSNLAKRTRTLPWDTTGTPVFTGKVRALCYYSGYLVAGGDFAAPGANTARYATLVDMEELDENIIVNHVYPNPAVQEAYLKVKTKSAMQQPELRMMDINGNEISVHTEMVNFNRALNEIEYKIGSEGLAAGLYYYMLIDDHRNIASGKLVIE